MRTRNNVMYLALGLLLLSCKNSEAPSLAEIGYQPNDLAELKDSPEYVDLSKYEIEEPKEECVPESPQIESASEPIVHIKYAPPVNGYTVTVDLYPGRGSYYGPAKMHFRKGNTAFALEMDNFDDVHFNWETIPNYEDTITLKHTHLPRGKMISPDCTFFFSDVDFDGTKELLVREPLYGPRGSNGYHVFELDGTERDDDPFQGISDMTEFNTAEKSITQKYYYGVILGSNHLKYRRQKDGSFALTDSTHIDYKVDFTDSIRVHYRKQGDKMVLVKKENVE
ncbi:MAG: hypothetical protein K6E35_07010 [Bacteroidales bacterium]|nr:hypothetical protein [Bacteroidales bacterium]